MRHILPYIRIENCKEEIFGGEIKNTQLADGIDMFKGHEGKYIHAELHINSHCVLHFSDMFMKT